MLVLAAADAPRDMFGGSSEPNLRRVAPVDSLVLLRGPLLLCMFLVHSAVVTSRCRWMDARVERRVILGALLDGATLPCIRHDWHMLAGFLSVGTALFVSR